MNDESTTDILRTGAEWEPHYPNFKILDADGWRPRSNFDTELITREEFERRAMRCTIQGVGPHTDWMKYDGK